MPLTRFLPRRAARDEQLHLVAHLTELRQRIVLSLAVLVTAFACAYTWHDRLIQVLTEPLPPEHRRLLTLSPTEPFFTTMKVSLAAALIAALPVVLYQLYAFVIPAIHNHSRRVGLVVVGGVASLFLAGVAFGYFVVFPVALDFLLGFGAGAFDVELRAGEYFGFALSMLLATGLMFEVPVAMLAFARLGVVDAAIYRRQWRVAIVVIAAVAAILPGGDPLSMMLLMAPQLVLYCVGIWLSARFGSPVVWRREADAAAI
jgi:sec-independent protein translocase protein TatC